MLITKFSRREKTNEDSIQEILRNLTNILNTKKGFGTFLKDLGIGDYNAYRSREAIVNTIIIEIKKNIELYEPRVKLVDIHEVTAQDSFRIRFELQCEIVMNTKPIFLIFDSIFNDLTVEQ